MLQHTSSNINKSRALIDEISKLKNNVDRLEKIVLTLEEDISSLLYTRIHKSNKDGLPIGLKVWANAKNIGKVWLCVNLTDYQVDKIDERVIPKGTKFNSLSAAAEFFSGIVRRNGWTYWRNKDGRTLKELYKC